MSTPPTEPERPNPFAPPARDVAPSGFPAPPPPSGYEVGSPTAGGAPPPAHPTMSGWPVANDHQATGSGRPTTPGWPGDDSSLQPPPGYGRPYPGGGPDAGGGPYAAGNPYAPSISPGGGASAGGSPAALPGGFTGPTPYGGGTSSGSAPGGAAPGGPAPYGPTPHGPTPHGPAPYGTTPHGGAAPGVPVYGVPGYGYPPLGTWTPAPPPVDGLAIASIITSGAGAVSVGLTGPVGLGLGIAALRRIHRTGGRGRGLAIAGVVVGGVMTLLLVGWVALLVWGISQDPPRGSTTYTNTDTGTGSDAGTGRGTGGDSGNDSASEDELPWFALDTGFVAGECLEHAPETYDFSDAVRVDCAGSHGAEVLGLVDFTAAPSRSLSAYDPALEDAAMRCSATASALVPGFEEDGELWFDVYSPHPSQWESGMTSGYCVLGTDGAGLTGSATTGSLATGTEVTS